jgi:hypothetical protein
MNHIGGVVVVARQARSTAISTCLGRWRCACAGMCGRALTVAYTPATMLAIVTFPFQRAFLWAVQLPMPTRRNFLCPSPR